MLKKLIVLVFVLAAVANSNATSVGTVFSENWESYNVGDTPASPWIVTQPTPISTGGIVVTGENSPFGVAGDSKCLFLYDAAIDNYGYNGDIRIDFTPITDKQASVAFDWKFGEPEGYVGYYAPAVRLFGTTFSLQVGNVLEGGTRVKYLQANTAAPVNLTEVSSNIWYHIEILLPDITTSDTSVTVNVTPYGGEMMSFTSTCTPGTGLSFIKFYPNYTNVTGANTLWLDNISVAAIPEPTTLLLLGAGCFALRRVRK